MSLKDIQAEVESEIAAKRAAQQEADASAAALAQAKQFAAADADYGVSEPPPETAEVDTEAAATDAQNAEPSAQQPWSMTTDFQDILRIKPKFEGSKVVAIIAGISIVVILLVIGTRHRTVQPKRVTAVQQLPESVKKQPPPFSYLVPKQNNDWVTHADEVLYDAKTKVAKYNVDYTADKASIVITQQQFPDKLKPRSGSAFQQFIIDSRPSQTVQIGTATLYFIASPGQPASGGKAVVIYATDSILLFARSNVAIDASHWTKLMSSLAETPAGK